MSVRFLVLADTHITPGNLDRIPAPVWQTADACDAILHAGDVMCEELLDALAVRAPLHAVLGNNDIGRVEALPEQLTFECEDVSLAIVHDSGARQGRENRMVRWFPDAQVVVFGHSHIPFDVLTEHGQRLFNPGSATTRRRQPQCSYGLLTVDGDKVETELVFL